MKHKEPLKWAIFVVASCLTLDLACLILMLIKMLNASATESLLSWAWNFIEVAMILGVLLLSLVGSLKYKAVASVSLLGTFIFSMFSIATLASLWGTMKGIVFLLAIYLPTLYINFALGLIVFKEEK